MVWLALIPRPVLLLLAVLAAAAAGVQTLRLGAAQRAGADLRAAVAVAREQRAQQAAEQRQIEQIRAVAIAGVIDDAHAESAAARRDAAALDAVARGLRRELAARAVPAGASSPDPAPAGSGPPATGPGLVFTDLLRGADARLRSCAAALDDSRTAGRACERAYDALTAHAQEPTP